MQPLFMRFTANKEAKEINRIQHTISIALHSNGRIKAYFYVII
jgi:hypothetical protein